MQGKPSNESAGDNPRFVASLFTYVVEVAALRVQLRDQLRLGVHRHLVLRVGRAPITAASMRRHVSDVLDDRTRIG